MLRHQPASVHPGDLARMDAVPFTALLTALETVSSWTNRSVPIQLYRAWIEANPAAGPHLVAAWFNLGVESARSGERAAAMLAYRTALTLKPDFHPAAINLGLIQELAGQPDVALATWTQAIQPDEARVALLNQRARLLERVGRLDEAERALRSSLTTDPAQPDAVQHWVHLRQRMCQWPVLASEALDIPQAQLIADCGPLGALSLTDRVAAQTAITARWVARKTTAVGQN